MMSIPEVLQVVPALLQTLGDGKNLELGVAHQRIARHFALNTSDLALRMPCGRREFFNRVRRARQYLIRLGLVSREHKELIRLTQHGLDALSKLRNGAKWCEIEATYIALPLFGRQSANPTAAKPLAAEPSTSTDWIGELLAASTVRWSTQRCRCYEAIFLEQFRSWHVRVWGTDELGTVELFVLRVPDQTESRLSVLSTAMHANYKLWFAAFAILENGTLVLRVDLERENCTLDKINDTVRLLLHGAEGMYRRLVPIQTLTVV
jgi:hypothetical protein